MCWRSVEKFLNIKRHSYSCSAKKVENKNYIYRLKQVDYDGSYEYSDIVEVELRAYSYLLEENFSNPFNSTTTIRFGIQNKSNVKITVMNVIGEEVAVIERRERSGIITDKSLYLMTFLRHLKESS